MYAIARTPSRLAAVVLLATILALAGFAFAPGHAQAATFATEAQAASFVASSQCDEADGIRTAAKASASTSTSKSKLAGTWTLKKGNDSRVAASKVKQLKSYGLYVTVTLQKNGKGNLNLFGKVTKGTWKATGKNAGTFQLKGGGATKLKLQGGKLKMIGANSTWMLFTRG